MRGMVNLLVRPASLSEDISSGMLRDDVLVAILRYNF